MLSLFKPRLSFKFLIHLADFYKTWHELYAIRFRKNAVLFNFLIWNNTRGERSATYGTSSVKLVWPYLAHTMLYTILNCIF
jgi:hypothetical protein